MRRFEMNRENETRGDPANASMVGSPNPDLKTLLDYIERNVGDEYRIFSLEGLIKTRFVGREESDTKISQLRKFYDDVVTLDQDHSYTVSDINSRLARIIPLARYSSARGNMDEQLLKLLDGGIRIVSRENDETKKRGMLSRLRRVLEAVVAYKKESKRGVQ
jgi:CRISPR type III-A-associated protein Csm2